MAALFVGAAAGIRWVRWWRMKNSALGIGLITN
jgi:hypothetical protein